MQRAVPHPQYFFRLWFSIAASSALILAAPFVTGCATTHASTGDAKSMAMPVSVVKVRQADVPLTGEWVGTLDGYVNAQIQPQVSGYLVRQNYREGTAVGKNEVLFQIDPRPFQAAVDQAEAEVGRAKGQLAQSEAQQGLTQINLKRDTPLAQARAIAQSQLDNDKQQAAQADAAVAAAKAAVGSAEAALTTAKLNLGFTQVRSLIGGVAGQATTQVGNLVSPQSVLTSVSQLDPIKVYFSISDAEYLALTSRARQAGGDLLSSKSDLPLTLTLADGTPYPHKGRIAFVDRQMNQQTGAIRIAASFPNPGNLLRPGQFGRVAAATEIRHSALLVPQAAVQELQGLEQIYVASPDNHVHVVNVKLGPQSGGDWIIESGLKPGDRVITDNVQKLRDGAPISPHEVSAEAAVLTSNPTGGR
ncbi:MAG TPA: efflux RND transporter periplasmic adaptor subunit [Terracidiphilus sp.]|nr:efflux RND transporter periplasmic adaptor subunit [Terracidiphilus sp.]